jgi:hypothetical protein
MWGNYHGAQVGNTNPVSSRTPGPRAGLGGSQGGRRARAPCGTVRADNFLPFAPAHMAGQGKNVIVTHGQEPKRGQGAGFGFQPEMQPSHWLMRVNHEDQCRALYARRVSLSEDPRSDCRSGESAGFWQAGPIPHGHASGLGKSPGQSHECHRREPSEIIFYAQRVTKGLFTAP